MTFSLSPRIPLKAALRKMKSANCKSAQLLEFPIWILCKTELCSCYVLFASHDYQFVNYLENFILKLLSFILENIKTAISLKTRWRRKGVQTRFRKLRFHAINMTLGKMYYSVFAQLCSAIYPYFRWIIYQYLLKSLNTGN